MRWPPRERLRRRRHGRLCRGGHLRDCIAAESAFSGDCGWMQVTARNPHAAAVELGTSRMRARPYLLPALRAQAAGFLQAICK